MVVLSLLAVGVLAVALATAGAPREPSRDPGTDAAGRGTPPEPSPSATPSRPEPDGPEPSPPVEPTPAPTTPPEPPLGAPWGSVPGLLQFRGNPTHTYYGAGPVPREPAVAWRYPDAPMCFDEVVGERTETVTAPDGSETERTVPEIKRWCGTGWTGQPVVWERPDGVTEVIVGAFDGAIHFLDAATGRATRPPFRTGQMIKGSVTLDPDGFPLLYAGSRDNYLRVIALDRDVPTELWRLGPNARGIWNNDWDGNPSVVDDILYEGGEDSWFYAIRLHRGYDGDGRVTVDPEILVEVPGFTDELIRDVGDRNVSIESSVAIHDGRAYFVNSGGRVVGLDLTAVAAGEAPVVFDYWVGDDADASLVVDADGMLYVTVEYERGTERAREVGQLVKLDPEADGDPRVWGVPILPEERPGPADAGGAWATPALYGDHLYLTTHAGDLLVVDRHRGTVVHREDVGYHEWSSPVVVEDPDQGATLVLGLCEAGGLRAYDLADPARPVERWTLPLPSGACVESTPAVWRGGIYVGSRDGFFYGIRDAG